jgi:hypothetical protein
MEGRQGHLDIKRIPTFSRRTFDANDKRIRCQVLPRVTLVGLKRASRRGSHRVAGWLPSLPTLKALRKAGLNKRILEKIFILISVAEIT